MNWLDIEIFACNMHELARYMHVVPYHMNELHIDIWSSCIRQVNMNMYIFGGRIYIYIWSVHAFSW